MRKLSLLIMACALLMGPFALSGQTYERLPTQSEHDLQARIGVDISKKIIKGLNITFEEELRLKNNLRSFDRINTGLGATYRINPWLRVGTAYTFMAIMHDGKPSTNNEKYWDLRHRATVEALFTVKTGKWTFSFRERPQFTFRTDSVDSREKRKCNIILRHRVKAEYKIYHLPLRPYVSIEVSNTLNTVKLAGGNYINRVRSMAGVEWKLNKQSTLDFYYRFDYTYNIDVHVTKNKGNVTITPIKGYFNILGVAYSYSF